MSDAITRVERYIKMRREMPLRGISDSIHGIHFGTEWEAELRLSDIVTLVQQLAAAHREGWEQAKAEAEDVALRYERKVYEAVGDPRVGNFTGRVARLIAAMEYKEP